MPSRFPGVAPYIEASGLWPDFHHEFITAWRAALRRSLPKHYEARINELVEDEVHESWIEIYHPPDRSLVAVLELLSPTNKRGETRSNYLAKRKTVLRHRMGGYAVQPTKNRRLPRGRFLAKRVGSSTSIPR